MKIDAHLPFECCPQCEFLDIETTKLDVHSMQDKESMTVNINRCRNNDICLNAYRVWERSMKE